MAGLRPSTISIQIIQSEWPLYVLVMRNGFEHFEQKAALDLDKIWLSTSLETDKLQPGFCTAAGEERPFYKDSDARHFYWVP